VTGLSRKLEHRLQPPISSIRRVVIIFVFRVVYTGYSIALHALAALRSLRIQLFHDAQPLQAKIAEKKLSLPADRDCWGLRPSPPKEMARDVFYPIPGPSRTGKNAHARNPRIQLLWNAFIGHVLLHHSKWDGDSANKQQ
jgi:hypothetical protein